jgi:beta-aspartyl-dipeptidase (metallo-type)
MMILIKGCEVFCPEARGRKDVLLAGERVVAMADDIREPDGPEVEVIDALGLQLIPGLVDGHVHIAGAGGEGGPATRTPELQLGQMLDGGITTVIGCLGTDGLTRSVESVLMKAKALRAEGVSSWIYTGSYQVPPPTLLGDVGRDVALIDEVIGVGEVAVADHRSSGPTVDELIRIAGLARVGGMLAGKAGIVNLHMGDARAPFSILYQVVERSELTLKQFVPTHCNRNDRIFENAKAYGQRSWIDLTAAQAHSADSEIKPSRAIVELLRAGVPVEHITVSSDGCGSLPEFDESGNLVRFAVGQPKAILSELVDTVREGRVPLEQALKVMTSNVADILKLRRKGRVAVGMDADLVLLDGDLQIRHLIARGRVLVRDGARVNG